MWLFKKLFTRKPETSFAQKQENLLLAFFKIEKKYWEFFNSKINQLNGRQPDTLNNYFWLNTEFEYVRLDYRPDTDLPRHIRQECDAAYQKVWGNN